ncbi:MAG: hypothetical protein IPH11_15980 [Ignavibacteriales bacterium]|nr:hypothetical protein [Ignavibacteriales bacterium]
MAFRIPIGINPNTKEQMFTWSLKEVVENFKDGVIYNWISIFNGVLISKKVIEMIGFPRKEMWIYGDEFEYLRRIKNCNLEYITIVGAIHYHPRFKLDTNIGFLIKK